jgi:hypothetical protein
MTGKAFQAGDVVRVTGLASVQFSGGRGFLFRIIRVQDLETYIGWSWLDGYQLDEKGDAVQQRSIYVRPDGLIPVPAVPVPTARSGSGRGRRRSSGRP